MITHAPVTCGSSTISPLRLRSTTRLAKPLGPRCNAQLTGIALRLSRDALAVAPSVMGIVRRLPLAGRVAGASLVSLVTVDDGERLAGSQRPIVRTLPSIGLHRQPSPVRHSPQLPPDLGVPARPCEQPGERLADEWVPVYVMWRDHLSAAKRQHRVIATPPQL
jgi:hypothetical protein